MEDLLCQWSPVVSLVFFCLMYHFLACWIHSFRENNLSSIGLGVINTTRRGYPPEEGAHIALRKEQFRVYLFELYLSHEYSIHHVSCREISLQILFSFAYRYAVVITYYYASNVAGLQLYVTAPGLIIQRKLFVSFIKLVPEGFFTII